MYIVPSSMVKELREITGEGMLKCQEALKITGSINEAIDYLREQGQEPYLKGLSEERFDVLDEYREILKSYKTFEELEEEITNPCMHRIRYVNRVGHYSYRK